MFPLVLWFSVLCITSLCSFNLPLCNAYLIQPNELYPMIDTSYYITFQQDDAVGAPQPTKPKKKDDDEYTNSFKAEAGMSKADKEKAFFETMKKQKEDGEASRIAGMGQEQRERYLAEKAVRYFSYIYM